MKYCIVSVFDTAAAAFGRPMFCQSIGQASRSFSDEVNRFESQGQNAMNAHPEDFMMYELGTFDDEDASFSLLDSPRLVTRGADVRRS